MKGFGEWLVVIVIVLILAAAFDSWMYRAAEEAEQVEESRLDEYAGLQRSRPSRREQRLRHERPEQYEQHEFEKLMREIK